MRVAYTIGIGAGLMLAMAITRFIERAQAPADVQAHFAQQEVNGREGFRLEGIITHRLPNCSHQWIITKVEGVKGSSDVMFEWICAIPSEIQAIKQAYDAGTR
jgi:hypothetical protein